MYIIAGLGNPSREYNGTRHNIGFDAITALSDAWRISVDRTESRALVGKGAYGAERVLLAKPLTYMNLSGEAVGALASYYRVDSSQVIILCDDINLEPGQLRIRAKGSAGGHNGLKNIISHLGTEEFIRVRIGVGEKPAQMDLADYVLGHFPKDQDEIMRNALKDAVGACELILNEGVEAAMQKYNAKKKPKEDKAEKPKRAPKPQPAEAEEKPEESPKAE